LGQAVSLQSDARRQFEMKVGSGMLASTGWEDRDLRELRHAEADRELGRQWTSAADGRSENPMSDRRWSAAIGQLTDAERQELLSAARTLAQLIADLAAEDTFFSNPR
jgi:hypothetical protein